LRYLLDANVCIALINRTSHPVQEQFERALEQSATLSVSSIAIFELWFGIGKSERKDFNRARVDSFLRAPFEILPFEGDDAEIAGLLRAELRRASTPIGAYDLLIAGQALRHKMTLVTANVSEFSRVKGLKWADWAETQ
jgi:tRNA(fMet)-specific endonuclease VapC